MIRNRKLCWHLVRGLLLVGVLLAGVAGLGMARPALADDAARVYAVIHPNPGIMVGRGGELAYEVRLRNVGDDKANLVRVRISYDPAHLTLNGSRFENERDWVSDTVSNDLNREQVTLTFYDLNGDETRSGTLLMKVNETLPDFTVIETFGRYHWSDETGDKDNRDTNTAPVLVASGPVHSEFAWLDVSPPVAPAGGEHVFFSDRFFPHETIVFWLNMPDGSAMSLEVQDEANKHGSFTLEFSNEDLPPGDYQMVAYGMYSQLTGFASFTVAP